VESSVWDNDRQFKLDTIKRSEPVKTVKSVSDVVPATKTGDRPSCGVEDGLQTVEWAGRKERYRNPAATVRGRRPESDRQTDDGRKRRTVRS